MQFYLIEYENGSFRCGSFMCYQDAVDYADSFNGGWNYTISEYDSEEDYLETL